MLHLFLSFSHTARNRMLSESVALNASSGSSNTPRLSVSGSEMDNRALSPTAGGGNDEDSGSDWDSWDDDEEVCQVAWVSHGCHMGVT